VHPDNQPETANPAFFSAFDDCAGGIGRFFLKILQKSGTYGRIAGQYMRQNLFAGAQTPGGDSHREGKTVGNTRLPPDFPHRITR
jgi:hypothetical protein